MSIESVRLSWEVAADRVDQVGQAVERQVVAAAERLAAQVGPPEVLEEVADLAGQAAPEAREA
jgi:hypothetical protein